MANTWNQTRLCIEPYREQCERLPADGKPTLAQFNEEAIVVDQAFHPLIADYAVEHQAFGGPHFPFLFAHDVDQAELPVDDVPLRLGRAG